MSFWKNGLQNEKMKLVDENTNKSNCYSYKLSGYPFQDTSTAEVAISVRRMAAKILLDLYKIGWKVVNVLPFIDCFVLTIIRCNSLVVYVILFIFL